MDGKTSDSGRALRARRESAALVLSSVLAVVNRKKYSVHQLFQDYDEDGSGALDRKEFKEAFARIGLTLSSEQIEDVMFEIDMDASGSIDASEFMDKLMQFSRQRHELAVRCRKIFDDLDADGSGRLNRKEIADVARLMGLQAQVEESPTFVDEMVEDMDRGERASRSGDGEVDREEFLDWFLRKGASYLVKPTFTSLRLEIPSADTCRSLFRKMDNDESGSLSSEEVETAVQQIWPTVQILEILRAFKIADTDSSGAICEQEFQSMIGYIIYFNKMRYTVTELEKQAEACAGRMSVDDFYCGCSVMGEELSDDEASEYFQHLCNSYGQDYLSFEQFLAWIARRAALEYDVLPEIDNDVEEDVRLDGGAHLGHLLQSQLAGEYGDVHLQDLTAVMNTKNLDHAKFAAAQGAGADALTKRAGNLRGLIKKDMEKRQMVQDALRFTTIQNDSFPNFEEQQLMKFVELMRKEDYFVGQQIITQGDRVRDAYYVLRRGRCNVIVDGQHIATVPFGMGFGELALVLDTDRMATIEAATPCEVFKLTRDDYEAVIGALPDSAKESPFSNIMEKFWKLMRNENGGRENVDFALYSQLHLRIAKALLEDSSEFDEEGERQSTNEDWAEDCARYGLPVTATLNRQTYTNAMYQLVYVWRDGQQVSYSQFLEMLFDVIAYWKSSGAGQGWRFRSLQEVKCTGWTFLRMKNESKTLAEAFDGDAVREAIKKVRQEAEAAAAEKLHQQPGKDESLTTNPSAASAGLSAAEGNDLHREFENDDSQHHSQSEAEEQLEAFTRRHRAVSTPSTKSAANESGTPTDYGAQGCQGSAAQRRLFASWDECRNGTSRGRSKVVHAWWREPSVCPSPSSRASTCGLLSHKRDTSRYDRIRSLQRGRFCNMASNDSVTSLANEVHRRFERYQQKGGGPHPLSRLWTRKSSLVDPSIDEEEDAFVYGPLPGERGPVSATWVGLSGACDVRGHPQRPWSSGLDSERRCWGMSKLSKIPGQVLPSVSCISHTSNRTAFNHKSYK